MVHSPSMTTIQIEYQGDLRCEAVHVQSGTKLYTDAPKDNEGKGESFSPTDLLATAAGTCMATIMGIVARRDGIDLRGMTIEVVKEMVADPARRVGRLGIVFTMPKGVPAEHRKKLEKAAEACPVHKSLSAGTKVEVRYEYPQP